MDCFLSKFMRGHLGYCCALKGHHNFLRHCPPASRGRAVPNKRDTGMRRRAGWEGELPLKKEQQHECWVTDCSSASPHQPSLGSNSDRRRRSGCRAPAAPGTTPAPNVQLIVEDVQAGVEEKAEEGSNGDVWVLGRRKVLDFPLPVSPHLHLVAPAQQKMLLGLSSCAWWGLTDSIIRQKGGKKQQKPSGVHHCSSTDHL